MCLTELAGGEGNGANRRSERGEGGRRGGGQKWDKDRPEPRPTHVLSPGLLVVHDTGRGGEDDLAEGTGGEEQVDPVLDGVNGDVEAGRDDARLVETAVELDDDLAASVVVDDLELADVACASAERAERASRACEQSDGDGMTNVMS